MRSTAALTLIALAFAVRTTAFGADAPDPERSAPAAGETFESVASSATRTTDVPTLLAPFVERCEQEKREIDRSRCAVSQAYLRRVLPGRAFSMVVDDPAAIAVSDYDAGVKGYRLILSGCVACAKPVAVGGSEAGSGTRHLITVGVPRKDVDSLSSAVEVTRGVVGFESLVEAKRWMAQVRPALRAELVFRPASNEWTFGSQHGYALELLAGRIYNRCTGEIVLSKPPSTGVGDRPAPGHERDDPACAPPRPASGRPAAPSGSPAAPSGAPAGGAGTSQGAGDDHLPTELDKSAIAESMGQIRAQVFACYQKFQVPGNVQLSYEVASNGTVQSLRLGGPLDGTPTGACVLEAGKNARFPRFQAATQKFTYPFFLRR